MNDLLSAFQQVQATTRCPFAADANLAFGPICKRDGAGVAVEALAAAFCSFLSDFRREALDGFVWGVEGDESTSLAGTASLFARTIAALARLDSVPSVVPWDRVGTVEWQYSFVGERLFLNVFSPCYPRTHSKHLPAEGGIVVFAQPEDAFEVAGVNPARTSLKAEIRRRFEEAGMPYDGGMIDKRIEAHLYLFPLTVGQCPVTWWTDPSIVALRGAR